MWHKGVWMIYHEVDGEELDELEVDNSVVHPIELDYKIDDTKDDDDDDDDEKDTAGYTSSECASLQIIDEANIDTADDDEVNDDNDIGAADDDDDDDNNDHNKIYNNNGETEEKDDAFYQREERALKRATLLAKLQKHFEEARSMRKIARQLVFLGKVCTMDNLKPSKMRVVIIVDFCQNIQIPFFLKYQSGAVYFFVPLKIYYLGIVDCNSSNNHFHTYMYSEGEGARKRWKRGGNIDHEVFVRQGLSRWYHTIRSI